MCGTWTTWVLERPPILWRRGGPQDAAAVADVMRRAFDPRYGEAWSEAQVAGAFAVPGAWLELGSVGGGAGLACFALSRFAFDEAELLLCAAEPAWRGRGIGEALVARVVDSAREQGGRRVFLEVREDNGQARRLYERLGFALVGRRRGYYRGSDGVTRDALTMARALG
jgi:ribosomal-protein-alanine N-acetyltransferase